MGVVCFLPARLSSTRIPRKPLQEIAGRSLLQWCWRAASAIPVFDRVVVATDSPEIERHAAAMGAEVVRTLPDHDSGTDRVNEAVDVLGAEEDDVIVNFQADEPFVDAATVSGAVRAVGEGREMATLAAPIREEAEWRSPGIVKVARAAGGRALYFSRAAIPFPRDAPPVFGAERREDAGVPSPWLRHVGLYVCTRPALRRWAALPASRLERIERLEQLRALEAGMRMHVEVGPWTEPGIDVPADVERAKSVLSESSHAEGGVPES